MQNQKISFSQHSLGWFVIKFFSKVKIIRFQELNLHLIHQLATKIRNYFFGFCELFSQLQVYQTGLINWQK